jgi:NAD(P)-dependent dehydrogenase (short-subunit alcohol dehydrogenase family)
VTGRNRASVEVSPRNSVQSSRDTVNAVASGPVYTGNTAPDRTEALGNTTLLGWAAQATEVAPLVAFLASP